MRRRLSPAMLFVLRVAVRNELIGARSSKNFNQRVVRALARHKWITLRDGYMIPTSDAFNQLFGQAQP